MDIIINQFPVEILALIIWTAVRSGAKLWQFAEVNKEWRSIIINPGTLFVMPDLTWITNKQMWKILRFKRVPLDESTISTIFCPYYSPNFGKISNYVDIKHYMYSFLNFFTKESWESLRLPTFRDVVICSIVYPIYYFYGWQSLLQDCKSIAAFEHLSRIMFDVYRYGSNINSLRKKFDIEATIDDFALKTWIVRFNDINYPIIYVLDNLENEFIDGKFNSGHVYRIIDLIKDSYGNKLIDIGIYLNKLIKINDKLSSDVKFWDFINNKNSLIQFNMVEKIIRIIYLVMMSYLGISDGQESDNQFIVFFVKFVDYLNKIKYLVRTPLGCMLKQTNMKCYCIKCELISRHNFWEAELEWICYKHPNVKSINM